MLENYISGISRRNFLKLAGLGLASVIAGCSPQIIERNYKTPADYFLEGFATIIPGARDIEKFGFGGADDCLVHIRQVHRYGGITKKQESLVNKVQEDIYKILNYLIKNENLQEVYLEGVVPKDENVINNLVKVQRKIHKFDVTHPKLYKKMLASLPPEKRKEMSESHLMKMWWDGFGAVGKLCGEGKLEIEAAETLKANEKGEISVETGNMWYITENRENVLLKILSKTNNVESYVVYGGAHNWRNNILEWNSNHEKRFSLIRITPESYPVE